MGFGSFIRELRQQQKLGIKTVAREIGVNYTYLSKLENNKAKPSEDLVERIASYFGCDRDMLYVAAEKIPQDAIDAIRLRPREALSYLRTLLQDGHSRDQRNK
jgi:transcriptional regulator with XRE-family HTH domain